MNDLILIQNIQPHFVHIVNRICTPSWVIQKGRIKANNLMLIYDGEGFFSANGENFQVSKGDLLYYKSGDMRSAYTSTKNLMKAYAVDFYYTCPVFTKEGWKCYTPSLPLDTVQKIDNDYVFTRLISLFDTLADTWISRKRNKLAICRATFTDIITLILDWKSGYSFDSAKLKRVEKVIKFMSENYNQKITLQLLADKADISVSYLSSIFKEITGTSPIDYLMDIRMFRAKTLLLEGVSVSETAELVGFNDVHYFSRYFKKYEGMCPSQYYNKNST
ncbi:MAG: helix-turn-helix transcriptional regulator [Clostridiales bacterium]|nr:helix-turn-helix transcriptional regulator [Clostridiales bacterium]